ncbi:MAG: hypothetical protein ACRDAM_19215, partial [Casimicrobium sp.]
MFDSDLPKKSDYVGGAKWIVFLLTMFAIFAAGAALLHVFSAPARVVSETMKTENILTRYEWFHDAHAQFEA